MADYKQLCAELLDSAEELDDLIEGIRLGDYMPDSFTLQPMRAVLARARAVLAEPEPEGPTKDELWELWLRLNNELPDRPAAVAEFWEHARVHTLALARWGNHSAPHPIPVTERLPVPEEVV